MILDGICALKISRTEDHYLEDRFLSSAGAGENCARPMRLPDPSPVLDKNRALMAHESWVQKMLIQYWGWGLEKGSYGIFRLQFYTG